jgi:hypothetical protein
MSERLLKILYCGIATSLVAMTLIMITFFAYWPARFQLGWDIDFYCATALLGLLYYAAVPLLFLGAFSIRKQPGLLTCMLAAVGWLLFVFLLRVHKPWTYYGTFPMWMFYRDFIQPMPIALAVGLAYSLTARKLLGLKRGDVA